MNKIKIVNKKAEKVATEIYKEINSLMPSIVELIGWVEEKIKSKINISYIDLDGFKTSGAVYFEPKMNCFQIWINSKDFELRQRFTICHEIGHIIKNFNLKYDFSSNVEFSGNGEERFCDRFAAAFLMPAELFIYKWNSIKDPIYLKKVRLTNVFKVSGEAVYYRAKELGLIFE